MVGPVPCVGVSIWAAAPAVSEPVALSNSLLTRASSATFGCGVRVVVGPVASLFLTLLRELFTDVDVAATFGCGVTVGVGTAASSVPFAKAPCAVSMNAAKATANKTFVGVCFILSSRFYNRPIRIRWGDLSAL